MLGWPSGSKISNMEHKETIADVLSLSLKYLGDIGFISSVLKYPKRFSFLLLN